MPLNIDDLEIFVKVISLGNFSIAAREQYVSPATVSKQIARLEGHFGVKLFERNTRRLALTDDGKILHESAEKILATLGNATYQMTSRSQSMIGTLRITAPVSLGKRCLVPTIACFTSLYPDISFDIRLNDAVSDLYDSDLDVAVRVGHMRDSQLIARPLANSQRLLVASPDYLARYGEPKSPLDLSTHQCLIFAYPGLRQNRWHLRHVNGQDVKVDVTGPVRCDNGDALRVFSEAGMGIAFRETWDVSNELQQGNLVRVLPQWSEPAVPITAVRTRREFTAYRINVFIEFLCREWKKQSWIF